MHGLLQQILSGHPHSGEKATPRKAVLNMTVASTSSGQLGRVDSAPSGSPASRRFPTDSPPGIADRWIGHVMERPPPFSSSCIKKAPHPSSLFTHLNSTATSSSKPLSSSRSHGRRRKATARSMAALTILLLCLLRALSAVLADETAYIGVNVGTAVSNMPSPTMVAALLKAQQIRCVRLYDADPAMLAALANTGIRVTVSVPNEQLLAVGQSNATAANWVARNVVAHVPAVNITAIAVGSEVLTALPNAAPLLVPALRYIHSALVAANLDGVIKVSTPHSSSVILDSFPPSQAFFNRTLEPVIVPMLKFLQSTGSYLMLNVYPYYDYLQSNGIIPLDYALFRPLPPNKEAVDANTLLHYTNVFDAVVDAAYFAMVYLNITKVPVFVMESGWPHKGDPTTEPDASVDNADTYNSNLIRHVLNSTGTPKQPGVAVPTYIYELYDEDLRPGVTSEKFWGLFDSTGVPAYNLHLSGSGMLLANDTTNQTFCVAREGADEKLLQAGLDWACGPGKVDCSALMQGKPCYDPDSVVAHASYAFNEYYHGMGMGAGTCYFSGVAAITTTDPSHESCLFSGSGGRNGTSLNGTSLAPSSNSTSTTSHGVRSFYCANQFLQFIGVLLSGLLFL